MLTFREDQGQGEGDVTLHDPNQRSDMTYPGGVPVAGQAPAPDPELTAESAELDQEDGQDVGPVNLDNGGDPNDPDSLPPLDDIDVDPGDAEGEAPEGETLTKAETDDIQRQVDAILAANAAGAPGAQASVSPEDVN